MGALRKAPESVFDSNLNPEFWDFFGFFGDDDSGKGVGWALGPWGGPGALGRALGPWGGGWGVGGGEGVGGGPGLWSLLPYRGPYCPIVDPIGPSRGLFVLCLNRNTSQRQSLLLCLQDSSAKVSF